MRGEAGLMAVSERDGRRGLEGRERRTVSVRTRDTRLRYRRSAKKSWIPSVSMSQWPRLGKISRRLGRGSGAANNNLAEVVYGMVRARRRRTFPMH